MKKILAILMILCLLFQLVSCTDSGSAPDDDRDEIEKEEDEETVESNEETETDEETLIEIDTTIDIETVAPKLDESDILNEIEDALENEFEDTIDSLNSEWEILKGDVTTVLDYAENIDRIKAFYEKISNTSKELSYRMYDYSLIYAETIMNFDVSCDDKYDYMDEIYDRVYDEAGDMLYDEIYDDLLDDIYETFYDGIIDDSYYTDLRNDRESWYYIRDLEYDLWSDTRSEVYDYWNDSRSDIYDFWSDVREELWDDDTVHALEEINDFKIDVEKLRNK